MTTRDLFGLAVRLLGLFVLWTATNAILAMIVGPAPFMFGILVWQVVWFIAALWLLRGAPQLVDFAYPTGSGGAAFSSPAPSPPPTAED